jgi:hypothetical protein
MVDAEKAGNTFSGGSLGLSGVRIAFLLNARLPDHMF